jgi:hypothetical protein
MIGPGKYDEVCLRVKEQTRAKGCLLIILDGDEGSGAPCKMDCAVVGKMPALLRMIADEMEREMFTILGGGNG